MKRKLIKTADGSHTISVPELDEHYHSTNGAINEAYHVFIEAGLRQFKKDNISILEIGFGTGLNALLTMVEADKERKHVYYQAVEAYPVEKEFIVELNYIEELKFNQYDDDFKMLHSCTWGEVKKINEYFTLNKQEKKFKYIDDKNKFDLIYFDAFGPQAQPDLWTEDVFKAMYEALKQEGVLVTYSAKGSVKRAMKSVGFEIEPLPGPKGKREMTRARKINK